VEVEGSAREVTELRRVKPEAGSARSSFSSSASSRMPEPSGSNTLKAAVMSSSDRSFMPSCLSASPNSCGFKGAHQDETASPEYNAKANGETNLGLNLAGAVLVLVAEDAQGGGGGALPEECPDGLHDVHPHGHWLLDGGAGGIVARQTQRGFGPLGGPGPFALTEARLARGRLHALVRSRGQEGQGQG
jgi:hypothetical protein